MQELQDAAGPQESGRVPRTIEVELTGGLVDAAAAGDAITVVGWVKVIAADPAAAGMLRSRFSDLLSCASRGDMPDPNMAGTHSCLLVVRCCGPAALLCNTSHACLCRRWRYSNPGRPV